MIYTFYQANKQKLAEHAVRVTVTKDFGKFFMGVV
jgi:hypothetical protein